MIVLKLLMRDQELIDPMQRDVRLRLLQIVVLESLYLIEQRAYSLREVDHFLGQSDFRSLLFNDLLYHLLRELRLLDWGCGFGAKTVLRGCQLLLSLGLAPLDNCLLRIDAPEGKATEDCLLKVEGFRKARIYLAQRELEFKDPL